MNNKDTPITKEVLKVYRFPPRKWQQRPAKSFFIQQWGSQGVAGHSYEEAAACLRHRVSCSRCRCPPAIHGQFACFLSGKISQIGTGWVAIHSMP